MGKIVLSMVGGFLMFYIVLNLFLDELRKLLFNIFIGICIIFGILMMYYIWKNICMLVEVCDEEESV